MPDKKPTPAIHYTPCKSSQISAYGYDSASQTLGVKFKPAGTEYHYHGFPPEAFEAMQAAESVGKFFGAAIRGRYTFDKQPDGNGIVFGLLQAQEPKYTVSSKDGRLVNRESGKPIPDDEPVFVIRAQDIHAVNTLRWYRGLVSEPDQIEAVSRRIEAFEVFADRNPSRMKEPDALTLQAA